MGDKNCSWNAFSEEEKKEFYHNVQLTDELVKEFNKLFQECSKSVRDEHHEDALKKEANPFLQGGPSIIYSSQNEDNKYVAPKPFNIFASMGEIADHCNKEGIPMMKSIKASQKYFESYSAENPQSCDIDQELERIHAFWLKYQDVIADIVL